jgi:hypothetical protein
MQSSANRRSRMNVSRRACRYLIDFGHDINPTRHTSATPQAIDHRGLR